MKQLFVTPQGQIDQSKATIKIDGTNGRIDAKSIYENWVQVATKSNLNSYATKSALMNYATKSDLTSYVTNALNNLKSKLWNSSVHIVKTCNASHIGLTNSSGLVCKSKKVTNDSHCIKAWKDRQHRRIGSWWEKWICDNGRVVTSWITTFRHHRRGRRKRHKTTYRRVGYAYLYTFVQ